MELLKRYRIPIAVIFVLSMLIKPALCPLILGSLISFIGFNTVLFLRKIDKEGIAWTGNIVEYKSGTDGHKTPLIEFTTITGNLIRKKPFVYASTDLSKIRSYADQINLTIPILYDPVDPNKFILAKDRKFNYVISIVFIIAGVFSIGLSISSFLGYIKIG